MHYVSGGNSARRVSMEDSSDDSSDDEEKLEMISELIQWVSAAQCYEQGQR